MTLQRLVLTFKPEGLEARVMYRTSSRAGPGTKARRREVAELARAGLQSALQALDAGEGNLADLGTSGFTTREVSHEHT